MKDLSCQGITVIWAVIEDGAFIRPVSVTHTTMINGSVPANRELSSAGSDPEHMEQEMNFPQLRIAYVEHER